MLWRHEVDVVAPLRLQRQHHPREFVGPDLSPCALLAEIEVLAEDAAEVAPGEEYRAASVPPPKTTLLAKMGKITPHSCISAGSADLGLVRQTIDLAVPGTDPATLQ